MHTLVLCQRGASLNQRFLNVIWGVKTQNEFLPPRCLRPDITGYSWRSTAVRAHGHSQSVRQDSRHAQRRSLRFAHGQCEIAVPALPTDEQIPIRRGDGPFRKGQSFRRAGLNRYMTPAVPGRGMHQEPCGRIHRLVPMTSRGTRSGRIRILAPRGAMQIKHPLPALQQARRVGFIAPLPFPAHGTDNGSWRRYRPPPERARQRYGLPAHRLPRRAPPRTEQPKVS